MKNKEFINFVVPMGGINTLTGKASKIFLEDMRTAKPNIDYILKCQKELERVAKEKNL